MSSRYHNPIGPEFSLINQDKEMMFLGHKQKPLLIGLVGPTKSGKTVIAKYLVTSFNFRYECLSHSLRECVWDIEASNNWNVMGKYGSMLRNHKGKDFLASDAFNRIQKNSEDANFVIDGIYHPCEIEYLKKVSDFTLWGLKINQQNRIKKANEWFGLDMGNDIEKRDLYENLFTNASDDLSPNLYKCYEDCDYIFEYEHIDEALIKRVRDKTIALLK